MEIKFNWKIFENEKPKVNSKVIFKLDGGCVK